MIDDKIINQHSASFIYKHKNSIVSAHLLDVYCQKMGKRKTTELYNRLSPILKETHYGLNVKRFIDLNKEIKIGDKFADIEQENLAGEKINLSGSAGKYTLLEFWASWCGPCLRENPELVKLYNKFRPKGFEIYAVSVDESRSSWITAIEKDKLPWINVSELNGTFNSAVQIYGVFEYPTNFLINPDGIIIAKNLRGKQLEEKLSEIFTVNSK